LKGKELANANGTFVRYGHTVDLLLDSLGNKKTLSISYVTPKHIEHFRDVQLGTGKAPSSVNVDIKTLRNAFNLAKKRGVIAVNPVDVVELPSEQRNTRGIFSGEQITALLKVASADWKTAIMLGYYIGARLGDAISLTWENVDFDRCVICYCQQKTKKEIECPMHPDLQQHLLTGVPVNDRNPKTSLTPTFANKLIGGRNGLSREFKQLMVEARIDDGRIETTGEKGRAFSTLSFHALRHTSVSALANHGVSSEIRMKVSGHTTESSHKTYTHLELETLKQAISKLPSVIVN
jgi:integrase